MQLVDKTFFFKLQFMGAIVERWVFGEESVKTADLSQLCSGISVSAVPSLSAELGL